jgi:hypothetical protein
MLSLSPPGTMGVGKSTIAKQMAISFGAGFSEGDRSQNRQAIVKNIVSSTMTVIKDAPDDAVRAKSMHVLPLFLLGIHPTSACLNRVFFSSQMMSTLTWIPLRRFVRSFFASAIGISNDDSLSLSPPPSSPPSPADRTMILRLLTI